MPTFEHTVEIEAPAEHVFEFMTEPTNWPRTNPSLVRLEVESETDDGVRLDATYRMLGISNHGELEMTYVDPGRHTTVAFESPGLSGVLDYRLSETNGVTTVVQSCEYEFGDSLLNRIVEPVAKRYNERQFRHSLQHTKELVEAEVEMDAEAGTELADDEPMPSA